MIFAFTSDAITSLKENEVFVFGSNIHGHHCGGAALLAKTHFGAVEGVGEGAQGQSYAIPTAGRTLAEVEESVKRFKQYVDAHPKTIFLVTAVGCGNGGYTFHQIGPLFVDFINTENVHLPKVFVNEILKKCKFSPFCNFPYTFSKDEFTLCVTDVIDKHVVITSGPRYGIVPSTFELEGETFTVVGVEDPNCIIHNSHDFSLANFLKKGAFFYELFDENHPFVIPEELKWYGPCPFPSGVVKSKSPRFEIVNGLVIDKEYKRVVQCIDRNAEHVIVPEGILEIFDGAFFECKLKTIELPTTLKRIQTDAFWECRELRTITLPKQVEYIGDYCFSCCYKLEDVKLLGGNVSSGEFPFHRCMKAKLLVPTQFCNRIRKSLDSTIVHEMIPY